MEYLRKFNTISNQSALLIIFIVWYLTATITTLLVTKTATDILIPTAIVAFAVLLFMTIVFFLSLFFKRTDIVDAAWGGGFVVAALSSFFVHRDEVELGWNVQTIVTVLVIVWALRLSYHIVRRLMKHPEDKRYVTLRQRWRGNVARNTYIRIFVVQALLVTIISIAIIHINLSSAQAVNGYTYVGVAVWLVGILFEAVGDWQLKQHLANPENKNTLMTQGLWRYSRHPNYFGEAVLWVGIFIMALGTPHGWVGVITPVAITYLLLFVSGIPLNEKAFSGRKGWAHYKKRTSAFLPLPSKAP